MRQPAQRPRVRAPTTLAGSQSALPARPVRGINTKNQIISSGMSGTLYTPGELVQYPLGFEPQEAVKDTDYQYNLGVNANAGDWTVDANIGYGKDVNDVYTLGSGNRTLFIDTHTTPTNFYDGTFIASQFVGTVDVTRKFNVGMASPLTFAFGVEAREDLYQIKPGDAGSQYKEGGQSYPGYSDAVAGSHSRKNYSAYVDFALAPIESVEIDVAGRAEHYSDFGDTQIGKITARWDITPQIAVRGTMATGFRAPTLQEEWYNTVNVSPTSATVQLPADSAAAKVLGFQDLKPEISTSYSLGIVAHPLQDMSVTLDAYSIALGDRISSSSTVYLKGGLPIAPVCGDAVAAAGISPDPTATRVGCTAFVNAFGTLTQGMDLTINYPTDFGDMGLVDWTLAGNYNNTKISRIAPIPPQLAGATFLTASSAYAFEHPAPAMKVGLTGTWSLDAWGVTLRETMYSADKSVTSLNGGPLACGSAPAGVPLRLSMRPGAGSITVSPASASPTWKSATTSRMRCNWRWVATTSSAFPPRSTATMAPVQVAAPRSATMAAGQQFPGHDAVRSLWRLLLWPRDLELLNRSERFLETSRPFPGNWKWAVFLCASGT